MARPRKPTKLLLLTGTAKRNPGRLKGRAEQGADGVWRESGPESPPLATEPPAYFDAEERERWAELLRILPAGVPQERDQIAAEMIAQLWAGLRRRALDAKEMSLLCSLLGKFGMTPAERSKVGVPSAGKPKGNPFQNLG